MPFDPIYDDKKLKDTINLGPVCKKSDSDTTYRMIDLILEPTNEIVSVIEKGHEILYETDGGRQKISCWLYERPDGAKSNSVLRLARTTKKDLVYGGHEISLYPRALEQLLKFIFDMKLIDKFL